MYTTVMTAPGRNGLKKSVEIAGHIKLNLLLGRSCGKAKERNHGLLDLGHARSGKGRTGWLTGESRVMIPTFSTLELSASTAPSSQLPAILIIYHPFNSVTVNIIPLAIRKPMT